MNSYHRKNQNSTNGAGLFLILTFVFLSISIWQTAEGYKLMFGAQLAWIFSFAIGLMMLYLSFEMRKRRLKGRSATGPLVGYFACAIFCFFGNFNAIYSRYNREELFKKELEKHKQELTAISTSAISALQKADTSSTILEQKVLADKAQLISQIKDPANSGFGPKSKIVVADLETLLGQKLTEFSGKPEQRAASYSSNIDNMLKTKLNNSKKKRAEQLIASISSKEDTLEKVILTALKPQNISTQGQDAIFETVDAINDIGEKTENFLGKNLFSFTTAEFQNQEIGKISHTFSSAFDGTNWVSAIISMLVAIAIDALVPFVIFVGTSKENEEEYDTDGTEREIQIL